MPHDSDEIGRTSIQCILLITRARAPENFSLGGYESDSTKSQHISPNLEFRAKILMDDKH